MAAKFSQPSDKNGVPSHETFIAGLQDSPSIAESNLLSACLRHPEALAEALDALVSEDFPSLKGRVAFSAMAQLVREGLPVDASTVAHRLYRDGPAKSGDCSYHDLVNWWGLHAGPYTLGQQIAVLKEASLRRQLASAGQGIATQAEATRGPVSDDLAAAERQIRALAERTLDSSLVPVSQVVGEVYDKLDRCKHGKVALQTPWEECNRLLGGLHPELVVVAARPGVGKTALACNLAVEMALQQGKGVFFASMEQSRDELVQRMLCGIAKVDGQRLRLGLLSRIEQKMLVDAGSRLSQAPLWIDDRPSQSALRISTSTRKLSGKISLVLVDYLQLVEAEDRKEARHEQVSCISKRLKQLSRDCALPVVALAQLNRSVEEGGKRRPRLSDLRESGGIEANADTVLLLHRGDERLRSPTPIEVIVGKQRNGPVGEFVLNYFPQWLSFQSVSEMEMLRQQNRGRKEDEE